MKYCYKYKYDALPCLKDITVYKFTNFVILNIQ